MPSLEPRGGARLTAFADGDVLLEAVSDPDSLAYRERALGSKKGDAEA